MLFLLQQMLLTLNDLERQFTAVSSVLCILWATKWLRIESRGFRYKVALYFSYLHSKLHDETEGIPFEF